MPAFSGSRQTALKATALPGQPEGSFAGKVAVVVGKLDVAMTDAALTALAMANSALTTLVMADSALTGLAMTDKTRD